MKKLNILLVCFFSLCLFMMACNVEKPKKTKTAASKKEIKEEKKAKPTKAITPDNSSKEEKKEAEGATPQQLAKAKEIIASVSAADIEAIDAKKKFKMLCATCHGFSGDLMVNGAKDLTVSKISLAESVAQVYHGKGLMTPYKGIMKDAEIVAVAKYIETIRK